MGAAVYSGSECAYTDSDGAGTGSLSTGAIEPERLPVVKPFQQSREPDKPYGGQGIILRHGGVELELPEEMAIGRLAELVKAFSSV